ncbi:sensor histidine kinase KdpD, partial [Pseudorhodobacter sp.]|uniref:sensor histidine kinase n=1 Tax=Pseudorhodobacter sp. TaxID=1934400 RepID=UPI0026490ADB
YTLFLPSFGADAIISAQVLSEGPFGIALLRPQALFGVTEMDPLIHALVWSMALNTLAYGAVSLLTMPGPVERVQGAAFVKVFEAEGAQARGWSATGSAGAEDLLIMAQRILGDDEALAFFAKQTAEQGKIGYLPDATVGFIEQLERRLSGSVGTATAHAMISQIAGHASVSVEDLMAVANEAAQIMEHSATLEEQREELTRTARQLREANAKLTTLSVQKDAFLSQISHELRTPMTSIRAFSEILTEGDLPPELVAKYGHVIHDETKRLTRLLDDLLDLSVLESGTVQLNIDLSSLRVMIDRAIAAAAQTRPERSFVIHRDLPGEDIFLRTDSDRLVQVFINLVSNARKYCDAQSPELRITVRQRSGRVTVDFIDNGTGIPKDKQSLIFEKFARLTDQTKAGGAGLGLAICLEVMANLGGTISYLPGQSGAAFRVTLPLQFQPKPAGRAASP